MDDYRDPEGLKDAIITILRDEGLRERMGQEAKKSIDYYFSIDNMVESMCDLYKNLTKN